jgi:hypothetical protein
MKETTHIERYKLKFKMRNKHKLTKMRQTKKEIHILRWRDTYNVIGMTKMERRKRMRVKKHAMQRKCNIQYNNKDYLIQEREKTNMQRDI